MSPESSATKRSANSTVLSSGILTNKYEDHFPSANSGNKADSAGSPYSKEAPRKLQRHSAVCPLATIDVRTVSSFGEVSMMTAGVPANFPSPAKLICNCALFSFHFPSIRNASEDEIFVMQLSLSFGLEEAKLLAVKLHLRHRESLWDLLRYDERMKSKPKTAGALSPFANFTRAMDGLMAVPHSAIKKALDKEKREKANKKRAKKQ